MHMDNVTHVMTLVRAVLIEGYTRGKMRRRSQTIGYLPHASCLGVFVASQRNDMDNKATKRQMLGVVERHLDSEFGVALRTQHSPYPLCLKARLSSDRRSQFSNPSFR